MKFLKWVLTVLAVVAGLAALGGAYAAIWITDHDLMGRVGGSAYLSSVIAVLAGFAAYCIWADE